MKPFLPVERRSRCTMPYPMHHRTPGEMNMPTIRRGASALSIALCACAPLRAQPAAPSQSTALATLDAQVPGWLAQHGVPSLALAYIRDGRVQWTRTWGQQAEGVPATNATLYNVASL